MTAPAEPGGGYDVVVVGAGPAGLAAAVAAAEEGTAVALVDAGPRPGGQYWRNAESPAAARFHHDRRRFLTLLHRSRIAHVAFLGGHHVQTVVREDEGWALTCAVGSEPRQGARVVNVVGKRIVLAAGAYDRQVPFPGWDLPGVLAAGGVQALLKQHGVVAGRRVVVAGTGPFLLSVADGLLRGGASVPAVIEAGSPAGFARFPRSVLGARAKLVEGAAYALKLAATRTPYRRRHAVVRALGSERLEAVEIARLDRAGRPLAGSVSRVACDALAVGWGFTPQLELPLQLGCAVAKGPDGSLVVDADENGMTSIPGAWAAGESTGIGGAELAVIEGEIAGRAAAGAPIPDGLRARRAALRRFAAAMHTVHPVPPFLLDDAPQETVLCRCEEVPVKAVRDAVEEWGATDARSVKLLTRAGMGWCQGRVCGYSAATLTARLCGRETTCGDLRAHAERPLAVPMQLGQMVNRPDAPGDRAR